MTERDAFEVRFHAAVHGYVGRVLSDLDPAEFAHRITIAAPRRHGFAPGLALRGARIPRRTWVPLVLAGLITALVAGILVVGSQPVRKLPAVVPPASQLFACPPGSTPDTPGPVDQARPRWEPAMAFDRRAGRIVAVLSSLIVDTETWAFDVCTNTWTQMHPTLEPPRSGGGRLVYDADSDATLMVSSESGDVWSYDLQADTWTEEGVAPTDATLVTYDPVSGLVVVEVGSDPRELWNYDVETDTWTPIHQVNGPGYAEFAYDASVDRIVAYAFGAASVPETWLLEFRTGAWSKSAVVTPAIVAGWGLPHTIVYDEAAERTVILSNSGLAAYDATADRWELVIGGDLGSVPDAMVYDPVNRRLVGPGPGTPDVIGLQADFGAFDLTTREWIVLLETSEGSPRRAPSEASGRPAIASRRRGEVNARNTAGRLLVSLSIVALVGGCATSASPTPLPASPTPTGVPSAAVATPMPPRRSSRPRRRSPTRR